MANFGPGLAGWYAAESARNQNTGAQISQMGGLLGIQNQMFEQQTRQALAQSGGDPEKAMEIALKTGNVGAASHLAPLVKIAQSRKEGEQTVAGMQAINRMGAPGQPVGAPLPMGGPIPPPQGVPVGQPPQMGQGAAIPPPPPDQAIPTGPGMGQPMANPREQRLAQLRAMSELPQYAKNPIVQQRLQAEIDRLEKDAKPMVEHRYPVAGGKEPMVQPHISLDNGKTWNPIPGSVPTPAFGRQVTNVNIAGNAGTPPGDFKKTGEDYLQSLPAADREVVRKVANYDINPQTFSTRGGHRERILAMVSAYDPNYDDTQYMNKRRAITQFGSGPQGNTARSLNVAIEHIDVLRRAGTALQNGEFTPGNRAYNEIANVFGVAPPNTFEGIKQIVANEVIKGTIGNAGAIEDRNKAAERVRAALSPKQLNDLMNGWVELMGGQVKGLERQYEGATRLKDFRERYLTQRARDAIGVAESKAVGSTPSGMPDSSAIDAELARRRGNGR